MPSLKGTSFLCVLPLYASSSFLPRPADDSTCLLVLISNRNCFARGNKKRCERGRNHSFYIRLYSDGRVSPQTPFAFFTLRQEELTKSTKVGNGVCINAVIKSLIFFSGSSRLKTPFKDFKHSEVELWERQPSSLCSYPFFSPLCAETYWSINADCFPAHFSSAHPSLCL